MDDPLSKDDLRFKTNFDGRQSSMEDNLWFKTSFNWRWPLMARQLLVGDTFDGRNPLMEYDLWWRITFDRKHPLMEDNLWWKTTFDGRRSSMVDDLWSKKAELMNWRPLKLEYDTKDQVLLIALISLDGSGGGHWKFFCNPSLRNCYLRLTIWEFSPESEKKTLWF